MKTRTALYIDRNLVRFFVLFLNLFVRFAGLILHIDHALNKPFKTIAVCKFKGIGSIIQSTPLLLSLKKSNPDVHLIYVSSISNKSVLQEITLVDEMILLDDRNFFHLLLSFPVFIITLLRKRIAVYIDLEIYSDFSSLITTLSLAKNRVGYYLRSSQYRMGIYTHMMYFNSRVPIYQTYLQMARLLNCRIVGELYQFKSESGRPPETSNLNWVLINVNASDLRIERRWPGERFVELIQHIRKLYPQIQIALIGNKAEYVYVEEIRKKTGEGDYVVNLAGKTSFSELIELIQQARLLITNDTGPMHLAFCTGTPVVAMFGPCSPDQYGFKDNTLTIYKNVYCSPCVHEFAVPPCKGNNQCMKKITVDEVLKSAILLIEKKNQGTAPNDRTIYKGDEEITLGQVLR